MFVFSIEVGLWTVVVFYTLSGIVTFSPLIYKRIGVKKKYINAYISGNTKIILSHQAETKIR